RELNGLLANNTDLAKKIAVDLATDLVSLRLLLPVDPDFPILGGKTLRVRAGAELAYRDGKPVVVLKGVSVMGVPIPNAWLGGLKNIDLMQEFGGEPGFWQSLGEGVESIQVRDGELYVKLKE
ncbi:MAG: arginine N-succinyltransferase, partial [Candidatus Electrothrix sp. GM3_4]|nr:arginine N-succinyltransferase [Candidatus Electrothrix sp. GM3_4]